METKRVDKYAVEEAIFLLTNGEGRFTAQQIRHILKQNNYDFGEIVELAEAAELQKIRACIGQLKDKNGKRKYPSTSSQMALDFGLDATYCTATIIEKNAEDRQSLINKVCTRVLGNLKRCPGMPEWVINEITNVLNKWKRAA